MEQGPVAALTRMMDAVNAGDATAYARVYAEDAVITIYGGGELRGRSAIEQYEVELLREFPGARLGFYSIWQTGSLTIVHYGVNGQTANGRSMGHEGLLFYRFHSSGLIEEERRYLDSLTPMAQLGLLGDYPTRALPALPASAKVHVAKATPEERANIAVVTAALATLDAKDESAFLARIAPGAVFDELILTQPFVGKESVRTWFETWTRALPDATTEIMTALGVGEFVLVETIVRGTLQGPIGALSATGKPFKVRRAAIAQVREGTLTRVSSFMNGKELAEAVGQWPRSQGR